VARSGDVIATEYQYGLAKTQAGFLEQVKSALRPLQHSKAGKHSDAGFKRDEVLSSYAYLPNLDWAVIVERPLAEAYEPLYASLFAHIHFGNDRFGHRLVGHRLCSAARGPSLEALRRGVEKIGKGDLNHHLEIRRAMTSKFSRKQFNKMVGEIKNSYQSLEDKVAQRTREWRRF